MHPIVDRVGERLDDQAHAGARGVKMHPAVQLMAPNHPRAHGALPPLRRARPAGALHCGPVGIELESGRRRSQVSLYEQPIATHPRTRFILGHAGALQMERALDLACRYPNVWLELSGQSLANVRTILAKADPDRVVYGSDWPFYHQAIGIAKVLIATEANRSCGARCCTGMPQRCWGWSSARNGGRSGGLQPATASAFVKTRGGKVRPIHALGVAG